ncbi:hypothetical protein [Shimazuella alba]|uniref:Uncharacterized protein n=1 Tax=Shimazuella alba TaxID=2690964 RepID=A0A6I4VUE7_9BACL|nr:hypothetical protein [Shimazuella alba]MXQ53426.1 hypothetical protein [Shimazuella alba]
MNRFATLEGHELMQMIENISLGDMNSFIGQQKRFHADWYKGDETKVGQRLLDMFHHIEDTINKKWRYTKQRIKYSAFCVVGEGDLSAVEIHHIRRDQ